MSRNGTYDAVVAGSGPAGSVAALVLARGGARVLLVDPGSFPRDKACGDLVGPRGVRLLEQLSVEPSGSLRVGDLAIAGPTLRKLVAPWPAGPDYVGHALAVPRAHLDAHLREGALQSGAEPRAARVVKTDGETVVLSTGERVRAGAVVGADGAMSRVGASAGLLRPTQVLWGLGVRWYVDAQVESPLIVFWEPRPHRALPGYGWLFPGPDGRANLGLGVGVRGRRDRARGLIGLLPAFTETLRRAGWLGSGATIPGSRRGGWLRMGLTGCDPAAGRVLLCGDAAGLVNPLQGEGIAEAMLSGRAAAEAILAGPDTAADRYRNDLLHRHGEFHGVTRAVHAALVARPAAISRVARVLTAPPIRRVIAGGWVMWSNDLLAGAPPSRTRAVARSLALAAAAGTTWSPMRRRLCAP